MDNNLILGKACNILQIVLMTEEDYILWLTSSQPDLFSQGKSSYEADQVK